MSNKITAHIPNTITCMNLLSGCLACIMAFKCYDTVGSLQGWQWTCVFIFAAALFDFCDGAAARALKAYSKIGAELDSLADLVSFGVAPSFLIFNIMKTYAPDSVLNYLALAPAVFGALRLARFNVYDSGSTTFRGLPIPSAAIFLMGVAGWVSQHGYPGSFPMIVAVLLTSFAMVGNFTMFSLKFKNFNLTENFRRYVLIVAAIAFIASYGITGFGWTILFYFVLSLASRNNDI
jgi:CDP-diacylglycerol--serine O-phosphatidyltransferase